MQQLKFTLHFPILVTMALALSACGGGGGGSPTIDPVEDEGGEVIDELRIEGFEVTPAQVGVGEEVRFDWQITGGDSALTCSLDRLGTGTFSPIPCEPPASFVYTDTGTFSPVLRVESAQGAAATAATSVSVSARRFAVNTTADTRDISVGDGLCADASGSCSLRAAVMGANEVCGPFQLEAASCVIAVPAGTYPLTLAASTDEDGAASGALELEGGVSVVGEDRQRVIIDGNGEVLRDNVFEVGLSAAAAFSDLTIRDGGPSAIQSFGDLTLDDVTLRDNPGRALDHSIGSLTLRNALIENNQGGGVESSPAEGHDSLIESSIIRGNSGDRGAGLRLRGTSTVRNTTISDNTATASRFSEGGGLHTSGTVNLIGSTVADNRATQAGGGIYNSGILSVLNSTMSGNIASGSLAIPVEAGGIYNAGDLRLSFSTVTNNAVRNESFGGALGGGLVSENSDVALKGVVLAGNEALEAADCHTTDAAPIASAGYNLFSTTAGCGISTAATDLVQEPQLGPLADNGGPTRTHRPLPGSPALNAVPQAACTDLQGNLVEIDQRGVQRLQEDQSCAIGAVEVD